MIRPIGIFGLTDKSICNQGRIPDIFEQSWNFEGQSCSFEG